MTINKTSLLALSIASILAISGCGGGGGGGGPSEPRLDGDESGGNDNGGGGNDDRTTQELFCDDPSSVLQVESNGVIPADGAGEVSVNTSVRVTFNAQLDPSTVNMSNVMLNGGSAGTVASTLALNSDTITIDPDGDLEMGTQYEVVLTNGIMAACENTTINAEPFTSLFTTGDGNDATQPKALNSVPVDGETLAASDSQIVVEFDKPIDPSSITESSFTVTPTQQNGDAIAATGPVAGTFSFNQGTVTFIPDENLGSQTYYKIAVSTNVRDLNGNALQAPFFSDFRTGGLVVALNDGLISQIPGLGDGLNALTGQLFSALEAGDSEDGLSSADNLLTLKLPLVNDLANIDPSMFDPSNFDPGNFAPDGGLPEFDSAIVAVCDPTNVAPGNNPECTVSLDLGLDATQLQSLADAFTGGDPAQIPELFANAFFAQNDGLGLNLSILDDSGLPLPTAAQDGLNTVFDALSMIPELGVLFDQTDAIGLARIGLLEGALLSVDTGGNLLGVDLLNSRSFTGEGGLLSIDGGLVDLLRLNLLLDNVTCPEAIPFGLICNG